MDQQRWATAKVTLLALFALTIGVAAWLIVMGTVLAGIFMIAVVGLCSATLWAAWRYGPNSPRQ